jgi:hypothetical protein
MTEEELPKDIASDGANSLPPASIGHRVDQFLSSAKKIGASVATSAADAFDKRAIPGSAVAKAKGFYDTSSGSRKKVLVGGAVGITLLFVILFCVLVGHFAGTHGAPTRENYNKVETGMSETQVDGLLGMPVKFETVRANAGFSPYPAGTVIKWWLIEAASKKDEEGIQVVFENGKATEKMIDAGSSRGRRSSIALLGSPGRTACWRQTPVALWASAGRC